MTARRSTALYRHLSALYPRSFRDEYGEDLVATFTEQLADDGATRVWWSTFRDLVVSVPFQYLEARMNRRPSPQTAAEISTGVTVAAVVLALVAGTGPVVGVFLLAAVAALVVATLAWKAARPVGLNGANRWRTMLVVGAALLAAVLVVINVPPYNGKDLPGPGWALMMLSLVSSVALIVVGLTMGIAGRSAQHTTAS